MNQNGKSFTMIQSEHVITWWRQGRKPFIHYTLLQNIRRRRSHSFENSWSNLRKIMQRWRGNLSEIKILFQYWFEKYSDFAISWAIFAEWLKVRITSAVRKNFKLLLCVCAIYHFESPDLEICNVSFVWQNIRGKLPHTAVQETSEIFEEKYIL